MIIILDSGHSYFTPGKRTPDGMREWEFNSVVAKYSKQFLETYKDVKVLFAHDATGQKDISLSERTKFARNSKGQCFISIHANAHGTGKDWTDANGIETFVMDKKGKSFELAQNVQLSLIYKTELRDRGVKEGNFQVIRETYQHMPSILIECGFMTNKKEAALLKTDAYRKLCAAAIVEGIVKTFNLKSKDSNVVKEETNVELFKPSTGTLRKEFRAYVQSAYDNKILSSLEWAQKIDNNTLTLSDAISLFATIENRKN